MMENLASYSIFLVPFGVALAAALICQYTMFRYFPFWSVVLSGSSALATLYFWIDANSKIGFDALGPLLFFFFLTAPLCAGSLLGALVGFVRAKRNVGNAPKET